MEPEESLPGDMSLPIGLKDYSPATVYEDELKGMSKKEVT